MSEIENAGAELKALAKQLADKTRAFFGDDHDQATDTLEHTDTLSSSVDDHVAAVNELEKSPDAPKDAA